MDLSNITQFLSRAKLKTRIQIKVAQNSNAEPLASDFYKALKDAGWTMDDEAVSEDLVSGVPDNSFRGVLITCKGEPAPQNKTRVSEDEPLFNVVAALGVLGVPFLLKRDPQFDPNLITLQFQALPEPR